MSLIQEAHAMVIEGMMLMACLVTSTRTRAVHNGPDEVVLQRARGANGVFLYEVSESEQGLISAIARFDDPLFAVRYFAARVGKQSLSNAVSQCRYTHFFPMGSSLEWNRSVGEPTCQRAA